jgi:exodeoxyribonuclease-3
VNVRFVSFNANGIRARLHQIDAIRQKHQPDVLAIQEIKVADDIFPLEDVQALGFPHVNFYGQKGHYGVALLSTVAPKEVQLGIPWAAEDQQRRFISAVYDTDEKPIRILNGYFPQGESRDHPTKFPNKQQFYRDVARYLRDHCDPSEAVILAGDMNVAPAEQDIGIGEDNAKRWLRTGKCCFLPEEREWLTTLQQWGLTDSYATWIKDEPPLLSWFDYRSRGFERDPKRGLRIDLILATQSIMGNLEDCGVDQDIRGQEKPSDHCPIWCHFKL